MTEHLKTSPCDFAKDPLIPYNHVYVFNDSMSMSSINTCAQQIADYQRSNEFGHNKDDAGYALLFKPGDYTGLNFQVNYYTQLLGLGHYPDDVNFKTSTIESRDNPTHSTTNFWRAIENLSIDSNVIWSVSQGSPLRSVHIKGNLFLSDHGWSSGGFMANVIVDGSVTSGTQQQWCSRNSQYSSESNWATSDFSAYIGDTNPPIASGNDHSKSFAIIEETPEIVEKPSLIFEDGQYKIMLTNKKLKSKGPDQEPSYTTSTNFYITTSTSQEKGKSVVQGINDAISEGKDILFMPGTYELDESIVVSKPVTLLGLGIPTLLAPYNGNPIIKVDKEQGGVKICGLLLDATDNPSHTDTLLQVGTDKDTDNIESSYLYDLLVSVWDLLFGISHTNTDKDTDNIESTYLYDIFCRVGGVGWHGGKTNSCITINNNNVIGDNLWLWRADHGANVGWTGNTADTGLIVNSDNVSMYGLAVEHFQNYQTIWNGDNGAIYFYQSELPYDIPNDNALSGDSLWKSGQGGYSSIKIDTDANTFHGHGIGIYPYYKYRTDDNTLNSAIQINVNSNDIHFTRAMDWIIRGSNIHVKAVIKDVVNDISAGPEASGGGGKARLFEWPSSSSSCGVVKNIVGAPDLSENKVRISWKAPDDPHIPDSYQLVGYNGDIGPSTNQLSVLDVNSESPYVPKNTDHFSYYIKSICGTSTALSGVYEYHEHAPTSPLHSDEL